MPSRTHSLLASLTIELDQCITCPLDTAADASTFEVVKSNAYSILANLGPHMEPAQLDQLFQRLHVRYCFSIGCPVLRRGLAHC